MYLMVNNRRFTAFNYTAENYGGNDNLYLIKRFGFALNY